MNVGTMKWTLAIVLSCSLSTAGCGDPVAPPYRTIGGRVYCERHYATVNQPNQGFWRAGIAQILGVGIVSALIAP